MAKYLDTSHISSELMELLKEAKEKIILVTYSLQVNTQIQERLKTKSKIGTLSEITLIYGNTKPKKSELEWMSEIDDLKVWQKKNLHAKCYINEKKAIISSMNLYDYSQTTNVEMGFLITKDEDPEAYAKMMEDIDDLKINGERVKPWKEEENLTENNKTPKSNIESKNEIVLEGNKVLSYSQQIKKDILENFRSDMSSELRQKSNSILSDQSILDIISKTNLTIAHLKLILKSDKKVMQLGANILLYLEQAERYTVGQITNTRYAKDDYSYDQIQMKRLDNDSTIWYDTKKELPKKNQIVGVQLNNNWFNDYIILEENNLENYVPTSKEINYSDSTYKTTKELAIITGLSSREINLTLTSLNLMKKKGNDWYATNKGQNYGAQQREEQYGKFIVWPEEIIEKIELN